MPAEEPSNVDKEVEIISAPPLERPKTPPAPPPTEPQPTAVQIPKMAKAKTVEKVKEKTLEVRDGHLGLCCFYLLQNCQMGQ